MKTAAVLLAAILAAPSSAAEIRQVAPIHQLQQLGFTLPRVGTKSSHEEILSAAQDFVFFADFVLGSGWSFQIAISNNSPTTSLVGFMGVAIDANHEFAVTWKEALETGSAPSFLIPPGGTNLYNEWPNIPSGVVVRGGVIIVQTSAFPSFETDTQMMSAVLTYRNDATGIEVTVPPLRVEDFTPPFFNDEVAYSMFVEESADVSTGLALWKDPTNEVCLWLDNLDGVPFENDEGYDAVCYGPEYDDHFNHSAQMLPEWFQGWDFSEGFQGRLVVMVRDHTFGPKGNDGLVVPMGLRANLASGAISAMPVVPVAIGEVFKSFRTKPSK